jgi:hypothetical protein
VEQRGGATQYPEAFRGAVDSDRATSRELFDQHQRRVVVQVGGEEAGSRDPVLGGELEGGDLGGEGGRMRIGTHPQDDVAGLAVSGQANQPRGPTVAEAANLGDIGSWGGGAHDPPEQHGIK